MTNLSVKKRKFLKPVEFAVAALLSVAMPVTASTTPLGNDNNQTNTPTINTVPQAKHALQKQLLVKPSDRNSKKQLADYNDSGHYSHSSHSSHSSHASHYSSSR